MKITTRMKIILIAFLAALAFVACDQAAQETATVTIVPTAEEPATEAPEETASPTLIAETPTVAAPTATTEVATATTEATATAAPETATPEPAPEGTPETELWPGIVYQDEEGLWQVDESGEPVLLVSQPDAQLSPDGSEALYLEDDNVWIVDIESGEARNLTEDSERIHPGAQWWLANPETIVLHSLPVEEEGPTQGYLTLVNRDGSDYRVVAEGDSSNAMAAPAPDGETIAYDEAGSAWLYHLENSREPFDPQAYGLPEGVEVPRIASPAWSPEMNRLAWVAAVQGGGYGEGESWEIVLAIFDLEAGTSLLHHPFVPVGRGGWFPAPVWSPDGEWISYTVESFDDAERGRWIVASDGSGEVTKLSDDAMSTAFFSPPGDASWQNGAFLIVDGQDGTRLFETGTWNATDLALPSDARLAGWQLP